jgi:TatD DNase family protein
LTDGRRTIEVASANGKTVWPAFGFHPERAELTDDDLTVVESQVTLYHARLVALGEVGLPWYSLEGASDAAALMERGRRRFERLLDLAVRFDLPVIVHAPHGAAQMALRLLGTDTELPDNEYLSGLSGRDPCRLDFELAPR